jgi:hypothetical protein
MLITKQHFSEKELMVQYRLAMEMAYSKRQNTHEMWETMSLVAFLNTFNVSRVMLCHAMLYYISS